VRTIDMHPLLESRRWWVNKRAPNLSWMEPRKSKSLLCRRKRREEHNHKRNISRVAHDSAPLSGIQY